MDMSPKLVYDATKNGIRAVKLDIMGFPVSIAANAAVPCCTVRVGKKTPFYPDIVYAGGSFTLSYAYLVLGRGDIEKAGKALEDARAFCDGAGPVLDAIMDRLGNGLDPLPTA